MPAVARLVAATGLAAALGLGAAGSQPAVAQAPVTPRTAVVRSLRLEAGEVLTVALHPTAAPIELRAPSGTPLEVCPGQLDGGVPDGPFSSWPSRAGFEDCVPFADDGSAALPSAGSDTFHLAFLVRGTDAGPATVRRLAITYVPGDGYFELLPAPIAAGTRGPSLSIRPASATTVGAQAYGIDYEAALEVAVEVRQRGRAVRRTANRPPGGDAEAFGPVRLGSTVRVTPENRGRRDARVRIAIAWE